MALTCNPDQLAALARCIKCLSEATLLEVRVYLLCQLLQTLGMPQSCEPNDLAAAAKCFKCQSGNLMEIQTYLLARLAGGSMDPDTLAQQAKEFQSLPDSTMEEIQTRLICQIAGGS